MRTFAWEPDGAEMVSETGLIAHSIQFGGGYRQVSYKGVSRLWRVIFRDRPDEELRDISKFLQVNDVFLWSQPLEYAVDGPYPTRGYLRHSREVNGSMVCIEFEFSVEMVGLGFAEQARLKYGARDAGRIREATS